MFPAQSEEESPEINCIRVPFINDVVPEFETLRVDIVETRCLTIDNPQFSIVTIGSECI